MGVYKEGKIGKYRSITKTGKETGKESKKEDFVQKVRRRNGKGTFFNSRVRE